MTAASRSLRRIIELLKHVEIAFLTKPVINSIMETVQILKTQYDGYCVGTGVEYPGIVVWGDNDKELIKRFKECIPSYKEALVKYGVDKKSNVEVLTVDVSPDNK